LTKFRLRYALLAAGLAIAWPAAASAGVSVGHSGWEWSNPLPQGNSVRALDFEGDRGYATGSFGTALASDDGGVSWRGLATGVTDELVRVRALGPDVVMAAGGCSVLRSDRGAPFRLLRWTATGASCRAPVASIALPAADVAYIVREDGRFYRSGDAGASWERMGDLPFSADEEVATDVAFPESDVGVVTSSAGVYRTADGGTTWTLVAPRRDGLDAVTFADRITGYAVGLGVVLKSIDAGRSWSPASPLTRALVPPSALDCVEDDRCIATARSGDRVIRTEDGGGSWKLSPVGAGSALTAAFGSATHALAGGAGGALAVSDDSGATWKPVAEALAGSFTHLAGRSGSLAFALGARGALARTTDGGLSWRYLSAPSAEDLLDVSFADATTGYALDAIGSLFRTADGGESWTLLQAGGTNQAQALHVLDPDRIFLVGSRGIRRSVDAGSSFLPVRRPAVRKAGLFGIDRAAGSLFVWGPTSAFASRDQGRTWKKLSRPDHRPLAQVDFVDADVGFALGKGGRVWRTRNRGRSWNEILGTGTEGVIDIAFSSRRSGYAAARDLFFARGANRPGYVLRTTDGGRRWRPQLVSDFRDVNGLIAARDRTDLLLAGSNKLFATTSGGDSGRRSSIVVRPQRKRLARPGRVTIEGRLSPAFGGEQLTVSKATADPRRRDTGTDWSFKSARVRSNGRFSTRWTIRRTSVFVAQWTGDGERSGTGSRAIKVRVTRRSARS
jgi:photosystem II stability/assembly factor-like uncharacterized protein